MADPTTLPEARRTGESSAARPPAATWRRPDLAPAATLAIAGPVAALVGAPRLLSGVLVLLGVLAAAERLAALRDRGRLDTLLVTVGAALSTLVLVGLVLGTTPLGLHATSWSLSLGLVSLVALAVAASRRRPAAERLTRAARVSVARTLPWVLASLLVVGVAVGLSERSVTASESSPLQMSLGPVEGTSVDVVVSASERTGPLEIRTTTGDTEISYPLITVEPGTSVTTTLALPTTGRYTITLNNPDQTQPLRTLILDR